MASKFSELVEAIQPVPYQATAAQFTYEKAPSNVAFIEANVSLSGLMVAPLVEAIATRLAWCNERLDRSDDARLDAIQLMKVLAEIFVGLERADETCNTESQQKLLDALQELMYSPVA